jgi:hypothetical protein
MTATQAGRRNAFEGTLPGAWARQRPSRRATIPPITPRYAACHGVTAIAA